MSSRKNGPSLSRRFLLGSAAAGSIGAAAASFFEEDEAVAAAPAAPARPKVGFALELGGEPVGFFKSVGGLSTETEVVEFKEGSGGPTRKIPGQHKYSNISLGRGFTATDDLWQWRKLVIDGKVDEARKDGAISVILLRTRREIARFNFYEGWPCKWYVPDMDSDHSGMAIEKIEIAVEKIERAK
jgi:phage tail-like protein